MYFLETCYGETVNDVVLPGGKKISREAMIQFLKFASTGIANTLIDFVVYLALTRFVPYFEIHIFIAKAISFLCAATFSFFANRRWTFGRKHAANLAEAVRFYSTVGSGIFINVGIHYTVVQVLHLSDIIGIIAAAGFTVVWGFVFSKFWVFID